MSDCWLEKLFHPTRRDVHWLSGRFRKFMARKVEVDALAQEEVSRHAPERNARVTYRQLGRGSTDSVVILYEDQKVAQTYTDLVCDPLVAQLEASPLTKLCVQRGVAGDFLETVETLRIGDPDLWFRVLQLAECLHLAYLCGAEYEENCRPENRWLLKHIAEFVKCICMNRADYDTAFANAGSQMETLLQRATALVASSCSGGGANLKQCVNVWHARRRRIGKLYEANISTYQYYEAASGKRASKLRIERILTT